MTLELEARRLAGLLVRCGLVFVPTVGPMELLLLAVFGLLLSGPSRFPELTRRFGTGLREFKDAVSGHTDEIRDELSGFTETLAASVPAIDSPDQPPPDDVTDGILTAEHDTV